MTCAGDAVEIGGLGDVRDDAQLVEALGRQRIAEEQDPARGDGPATSSSFLARNQLGARPIWASDMPKRARLAGDDQIAMQRQLVAAGDGIALHDGDDGQRIDLDRVQHGLDGRGAHRPLGPLPHIEAGAEHRSRRADHGHALVGVRRLA